MTKEVKKTQKKNLKKEEIKKQPKKEIVKEEKVMVEEKNVNKKIENKKVEKKKETRNNSEKFTSAVKSVDNNRKAILFGVVGFLLGTLLFRCILWPDRIATLKDGTQPVANIDGKPFTADDLYENMKNYYSVNILLNEIDDIILTKKYPETDEMNKEVKDTADSYFAYYESSGSTREEFLSYYGFASEADFIESLKLDHRRNLYYEDYVEELITDKEIDKYYADEVFGDVDSKHILVKIDEESEEGLSDEEAKKLANEILKKLNDGKSWDEVTKEYKDKIVTEELGYNAFNASLESSYLKECKNLEVGKYSKTPVKTSYGYHIVFKIAQKDKPKLDEVKDDIIEILANEKKNADSNLLNKSLIAMREEAKLEFVDTKLGDEYKKFVNNNK